MQEVIVILFNLWRKFSTVFGTCAGATLRCTVLSERPYFIPSELASNLPFYFIVLELRISFGY